VILPRIRRVTGRSCYACHTVGVPLTTAQFCPTCADIVCRTDNGERAGLPVPLNVPAAVAALEQHYLGCRVDRRACLVCALLTLANTWCPECRRSGDDHIKVGPRGSTADLT
jgi:hypothetical protein